MAWSSISIFMGNVRVEVAVGRSRLSFMFSTTLLAVPLIFSRVVPLGPLGASFGFVFDFFFFLDFLADACFFFFGALETVEGAPFVASDASFFNPLGASFSPISSK